MSKYVPKKYVVVDELNDYEEIKEFDTIEECNKFIEQLKQFDKRHNNLNRTKFRIYKNNVF